MYTYSGIVIVYEQVIALHQMHGFFQRVANEGK